MRPKAVNHGNEKFAKCWKTAHQRPSTCGLNRVSRLSPKSNSGGIHIVEAHAKARECLARIFRGKTIIYERTRAGRKPGNIIAAPALLRFRYNQRLTDCYSSRALRRTVATPCSHLT